MAEEDTLDTFVAPRYRKQRATPSSKETKARVNEAAQFAADMVIPQTPFDAGLMLIPGGKIARKAGAALMALDAGDAEAGPLTKLLKALKGSAQDSEALENAVKEQNMLQGFYRGYAGQNPDTAELFITPQKRVADFYAQKRSSQTGETPHAEMVLIDQLTGKQYGHSTLGTGANPPLTTMARKIKAEDVKGRTQLYGKGGAVKSTVKKIINLFDDGEEVALTAAQRAEAGRKAAELIKAQEQVKASEALGQLMEKGTKRTTTTQSDRTRVGSGNIGGAAFPAISQADPAYAGKVWGVMDEGTAARLKNLTDPDTAWTTMLGAANQLKSNPIVFDKLKRQFLTSMKEGNLPPELEARINHNLALTFGEGASIRDPKIWKQADTFEKRAAIAELLMGQGIAPSKGGVALGGEKSGRGVIFKPTEILKRETEPSLLHGEYGGDVPTYAAGPRLFKIEKESEYRPDLHPGFPTLLRGEDLGFSMKPTPTEVYLPDWHARFKKANPDRAPGYYDLSLGVKGEGLPSQEINDAYIRHLIREGYAEGGSVKAPAATYDPNLIDEIVNSIDEPMGYAEGGTVTGPDFDFKEDPETLRLYKHAMKQFMPNQEDTISTVSTGVQGRVGGGNLSAGIDMNRMTKGQQDQLMKSIAASYNVDLGDVNLNTRLEAPLDAKDVYVGMLNGSIPIGEGRAMLGVQGIKTPYGSDMLGYNAGYSGKVGAGRLNVNVNKPKRGKPSAQVQYQIPFADGGSVHMGKGGALSKLVKKITAGSDVLPAAEKEIIQAPSIIIPSKVSNVKQAIRESKGNYGAKRVERAADEIKNLEKLYTEQALREAFGGDNAKALMSMNPNDFENFASKLHTRNVTEQGSMGDKMRMSTEDYLRYLRTLPEGFNDVPFLQINKQEAGLPLVPYITGHEGRHRSRALAGAGEQSNLVRLIPSSELREPLPRRSQEEYIEALKQELEMTGNIVKPEKYYDDSLPKNIFIERPPIDLPDIYAKGGSVRMAQGGSVSAYDADLVDAIANQFM